MQPTSLRVGAHSPGLVKPPAAFLGGVGGMEQEMNLPAPGGGLDLVGTADQKARTRLEPEAVERRLAQGGLDPFAKIVGYVEVAGFESPGERAAQLAPGLGLLERRAVDAYPGAAARRAGANIGRDPPVGTESETNEIVASGSFAGEDTGAFGRMSRRLSGTCAFLVLTLDIAAFDASTGVVPGR